MRSMTGYGKSVYSNDEYLIEFEIKSVNSRFLEIRLNLPRELTFLEIDINNMINKYISRGKITGRINFISFKNPDIKINKKKLIAYKKIYDDIKRVTNSNHEIPIEIFLNNEDIIIQSDELSEDNDLKIIILEVIKNGIDQHQKLAIQEGNSMKSYLIEASEIIYKSLKLIEKSFPEYKKQLNDRIKNSTRKLYSNHLNDDDLNRIALEVALYVEKYDITEEVIRMHHHLDKFKDTIDNKKDCGKTLNFILQEMHREINTMGSKYNHNSIFNDLIVIKEEIEKCREIVQNII